MTSKATAAYPAYEYGSLGHGDDGLLGRHLHHEERASLPRHDIALEADDNVGLAVGLGVCENEREGEST